MKYRPQRVAKLIRNELSEIIGTELEFENALMTITEVEIDKKLETARVKFSVIPSEKIKPVLRSLNQFRNRLQYLLMKKINIKPMPQIKFELDRGPEHAADVEKLLNE